MAQPAGVRRRRVGERKCSERACRCAGASEGLRRGMGGEVGGECIAQPAGVRRDCVGERRRCVGDQKCSGRACRCAGASEGLRRGMSCGVGEECIAQPAGVGRGCVGERKCSGRACAVRGRAEIFSGEWVVRSAGLTHFRRSSSRVRVLLYIRPPRHRREIKAMGQKRRSRECSSPAKASAPAPSAFIFPCPRSHFRVRVHTSPAWPSAAPTKNSASRRSSYPQWVIHGKVIHIVAHRPVQNVLGLAPAHAYI